MNVDNFFILIFTNKIFIQSRSKKSSRKIELKYQRKGSLIGGARCDREFLCYFFGFGFGIFMLIFFRKWVCVVWLVGNGFTAL
jgi:hypothetical protein